MAFGGANLPSGVEMATEKEEQLAPLFGGTYNGAFAKEGNVDFATFLFTLVNSLVEKDNSKLFDGTGVYIEEVLSG